MPPSGGARAPGTACGIAAIGLWASLAVLTAMTGRVPPFQLLAMGFGIGGVAGLAWLCRPAGPGLAALRQPKPAALIGIAALFGYHALYFVALKTAPPVEANLVNYLWPLLIVVFAALALRIRVRAGQWAGTLLGLAAMVLVVTRGRRVEIEPAHALGYAAALGSALIWAAYSVANRRFAGVPSSAIVGNCVVVALLGGLAHLLLETTVAPSALEWLAIVALGLGPVGAAFALWDAGTKHGDIALLGTLAYAAPLLSTGLLLLSGRASPHWSHAAAVALLLAGAGVSAHASRVGELRRTGRAA